MQTSYDFIAQIYEKVTPEILKKIGKKLEKKAARFRVHFDKQYLAQLDETKLRQMSKHIFCIKKLSRKWDKSQYNKLTSAIIDLIHGQDDLAVRFNTFIELAKTDLDVKRPYELASELLCFYDPDKYWLWSSWIWDPSADTGALPLVISEGVSFERPSMGEMYLQIGKAIKQVNYIADLIGIREPNTPPSSRFEVTIFLCAVFAVYMYTVTRMRMTKEFNTILPDMVELIHRLLGVHRYEEVEI
jgi:hypothetical protein